MNEIDPQYQFLSMKDLTAIIKRKPPTIYRWIKAGTFPPPVKLGPNSSGWRLSDYEQWAESRTVELNSGQS